MRARADSRIQGHAREVEAKEHRRVSSALAPELRLYGLERSTDLEEFECPHDPAPVIRMDGRGGAGISRGEQPMGALGPDAVVQALRTFPDRRIDLRRQAERADRRP